MFIFSGPTYTLSPGSGHRAQQFIDKVDNLMFGLNSIQ